MVGIGEVKVSRDRHATLVAYGLGSCIGVCLYDATAQVGGLAHVMLPSSAEAANHMVPTRFADQAVPKLLEEMVKLGASPRRVVAKIAGGAKMLTGAAFANGFNIGSRNAEAVRSALGHCGVPLLAAEVGGNQGRTLSMVVGSGTVLVRTVGEKETQL